jgi:hypothetical protein
MRFFVCSMVLRLIGEKILFYEVPIKIERVSQVSGGQNASHFTFLNSFILGD